MCRDELEALRQYQFFAGVNPLSPYFPITGADAQAVRRIVGGAKAVGKFFNRIYNFTGDVQRER